MKTKENGSRIYNSFKPKITSQQLGSIYWVDKDQLLTLIFAEGTKERLPMLLNEKHSNGFGIWKLVN